jgi:methylenetetrahydrofolate dehydrogenase (NADP+)/methenyltetrahydrofolate cyclohydrolase
MVIDGKQISREVLERLKKEIGQKNLKLRLAAVLVSNNPGIKKFVELKGQAAKEIGVDYDIFEFPETITEDFLKGEVRKIVQDEENDGVLVELPLPKGINAQNILNEINIEKDVDALSHEAQDKFFSNKSVILPPAVEAVKTVLEFYGYGIKDKPRSRNSESLRGNLAAEPLSEFSLRGKKAVVFGYGLLVGRPVAHWLSQGGAQVVVIDKYTKDPRKYSIEADIVVSGVGKPGLISGDMVKDGVIAIDFGYENKDGQIVGDFKFDEIAPKASLITPVPGGIGPVVVAAVLKNLVRLSFPKNKTR